MLGHKRGETMIPGFGRTGFGRDEIYSMTVPSGGTFTSMKQPDFG